MKKDDIKLFHDENLLNLYLSNLNIEPNNFILKYSKKIKGYDLKPIAEQIHCYQKAKHKLPELANNPLILYDKISIQQASSELTAKFKASLFTGNRFIDLTGGLGIDTLYISKNFTENHYCEVDKDKFSIFEHNIKQLKINNINLYNGDSLEYLKSFDDKYFDLIYIDPARRDDDKRFIKLEYCKPNILEIQDLLLSKSKNILIKLAPAFDIDEIVKKINNVSKIYAIEVNYEMKEILVEISEKASYNIMLIATDLKTDFSYNVTYNHINKNIVTSNHINANAKYCSYLHPSILKLHLTNNFCKENNILPFNMNSSFAVGDKILEKHRNYKIMAIFDFDEILLKQYLKKNSIYKATFLLSNANVDIVKLRKQLKIKEAEDYFIILTADITNTIKCIIGTKID